MVALAYHGVQTSRGCRSDLPGVKVEPAAAAARAVAADHRPRGGGVERAITGRKVISPLIAASFPRPDRTLQKCAANRRTGIRHGGAPVKGPSQGGITPRGEDEDHDQYDETPTPR